MASKVWFITGTSSGFGREWAIAALDRGDQVAATVRNMDAAADLVEKYGDAVLPVQLDVTDRPAAFAAVERAHQHFGRLDVVVNNAGYILMGVVEALSEQEARDQMETNVFGALWITQAALPIMRAQGSGHIVQVSSIGGITAFPNLGMYHASKWALEGFSQSLAAEAAVFGIKVTIVEPGGYATNLGPNIRRSEEIADYVEPIKALTEARMAKRSAPVGNPTATREAILKVVDDPNPPLRVFFGKEALNVALADYEQRVTTWHEWEDVTNAAHGDS